MGGDAAAATIRRGEARDLAGIVEIDNHYIAETAITFHTQPFSVEARRPWFDGFSASGPHQLFVAERAGRVLGYASSSRFRPKAAYARSVETTIYLAPDATGAGVGRRLYESLFAALEAEDVHLLLAGITLPNEPSLALHASLGFEQAGVFHDVGFKHGRYWDVAWFQRKLRLSPAPRSARG